MLAYIKGTLVAVTEDGIIIENNGIGYTTIDTIYKKIKKFLYNLSKKKEGYPLEKYSK